MRDLVAFIVVSCLTGVIAAVGCGGGSASGGSGGGKASSAAATSSATTSTAATTGTGGGTGGASGTGGSPSPDGGALVLSCTTPPAPAPDAGSCVTVVANDAGTGIVCNPVTNAPCAPTDECDVNTDNNNVPIGFMCFPPPNIATLCQGCDVAHGPNCMGGTTCFATHPSGSPACARYCCTDADCGSSGKCTTQKNGTSFFGPVAPNLGICAVM